jgi:hypothetical protein
MTRRTRRLLLLALPAGLALALACAWLLWPRTAITRANAEKIQVGLTLAEVEAILDGPARDESTGPVNLDVAEGLEGAEWELFDPQRVRLWVVSLVRPPGTPRPLEWQSNEVVLRVRFDPEGRVAECDAFPMRRVDEGPLDRLRRWLGL